MSNEQCNMSDAMSPRMKEKHGNSALLAAAERNEERQRKHQQFHARKDKRETPQSTNRDREGGGYLGK